MKQFSLEEYLKNPERKVVTRNGCDVRIICTDVMGSDAPIIALVYDAIEEKEHCLPFQIDGKFPDKEEPSFDLFFAPIKNERWVNVYRFADCYYRLYNTRHEAKEAAKGDKDCIATVKIEWEE